MPPTLKEQYYLYYINDKGEGMLLTQFWPASQTGDGVARALFTGYYDIFAWKMPLLFPTIEQAEVAIAEQEYNLLSAVEVKVGRWINMDVCRTNIHPPVDSI